MKKRTQRNRFSLIPDTKFFFVLLFVSFTSCGIHNYCGKCNVQFTDTTEIITHRQKVDKHFLFIGYYGYKTVSDTLNIKNPFK